MSTRCELASAETTEATVASIIQWVKDVHRTRFLTLTEWSDQVASTSAGAAVLEHVIRNKGLYRGEDDIHTDNEWRCIADNAGIKRTWGGYKFSHNEQSTQRSPASVNDLNRKGVS